MKKVKLISQVIIMAGGLMLAANVSAAEKTEAGQGNPLPRVLLIGDSS